MSGSGSQEILMEEELVTTGCLNRVLSGKSHAKPLVCVKTVGEVTERLPMECFLKKYEEQVTLEPAAL